MVDINMGTITPYESLHGNLIASIFTNSHSVCLISIFLNNAENRSTYIKMDTGVVYFMVRSETIGLARASRLSVCMITDYGFERVEYEYFDAHYHIEYAFKFKIIRIDLAAGVSNPSLYLTLNVGLYSTTMLK